MKNLSNRDDAGRLIETPPETIAPTNPSDIAALDILKKKALSMIALSVKDDVISYIINMTEFDLCWKTLKDLYSNTSNSRKLFLRNKLS